MKYLTFLKVRKFFLNLALKLGEYKSTEDFTLEDTMNSVEVNHIKMDPHCKYREANTFLKLFSSGKVKKMEDLNLNEVNRIFLIRLYL